MTFFWIMVIKSRREEVDKSLRICFGNFDISNQFSRNQSKLECNCRKWQIWKPKGFWLYNSAWPTEWLLSDQFLGPNSVIKFLIKESEIKNMPIWSQLCFLLLFSVRVCPFCPTFEFSALFTAGFCWHACLKTQQQPIKRLNLQESSQFFSQIKTTEATT